MRELSFKTVGGQTEVENPVSAYQPSDDIRDITLEYQKDYQIGYDNLRTPYEELNGMSILAANDEYQRTWLAWSPPPSVEPDEEWRWTGVRPITRNRIISTAAHLTAKLNAPAVFAQNDADDEDRIWGEIAELLLEYNIRTSDYEETFLFAVIAGLVNCISYFTVDYVDAKQAVWKNGKQQIVDDEETSGFQYGIAPCDEMLFDNPWEYKWQKQRMRIRSKQIAYEEAESIYGEHDNFSRVTPGIRHVVSEEGIFYDVEDLHGSLVSEDRWLRRRKDSEIPFVNGVYFGNDNVSYNPFVHRTNKDLPKYPEAKYGAEPIDAKRFIGYKSLAAKMLNDQELVDRQWQSAMDANLIETFAPVIITGTGKVDANVMIPAAVTAIEDDAKVTEVGKFANSKAAFAALHEAERSINESSPDPQLGGQTATGDLPSTKAQSLLIQSNAETNLGLMGRMILGVLKDVGSLMLDDIIRHQTIGNVQEILGGVPRMAFNTFIIDNKQKNGETKNHIVRFTDELMGASLSEEEQDIENLKLLEKAGKDREIHLVNPALFSRLKFLVTVDYQELLRRNTPFERAFKLAGYDKAISNPLIMNDPEAALAVTRDFLMEPIAGGNATKYLPKKQLPQGLLPEQAQQQQQQGGQSSGQDIPTRFTRSAAMESANATM